MFIENQKQRFINPHPLANLFKISNCDEPIATVLGPLDYLYEVLLEIPESKNCDEVLKEEIYKVIHDSSLNEKHDFNDVIYNSINVSCANNMQNLKLGDANFDMSTTYCNHHDWVILLMILKIYLSPMMNMRLIIVFAIILKVGLEKS